METLRISTTGQNRWPNYKDGTPILYSDFVEYLFQGSRCIGQLRGMAIDQ